MAAGIDPAVRALPEYPGQKTERGKTIKAGAIMGRTMNGKIIKLKNCLALHGLDASRVGFAPRQNVPFKPPRRYGAPSPLSSKSRSS